MLIVTTDMVRDGCGWYRIIQPLAKLKQHFQVEVDEIGVGTSDQMIAAALEYADILLLRPGGEVIYQIIDHLAPVFKENGKTIKPKIVIDSDDNATILSPYSEHYLTYGLEEVEHDGKKLWEDGRNINIEANRRRVQSLLSGIGRSDLFTSPSKLLANFYGEFAGATRTAVLPNCIDFDKWWIRDIGKSGLRVGWHGGVSHYEDMWSISIKGSLAGVLNKHKATFVNIGTHFPSTTKGIDNVELHAWVKPDAHSYRMALLNLDVGVIPLLDAPFNQYKSPIKWYEYSALGIPSVVANVTPYKEEVEHGQTGLLYNDLDDFKFQLNRLLGSKDLRERIGRNALEWVRENRDADKCAGLWHKAYSDVIGA
jgi:glycosyltransferase involved in cell wall biosynthesis